MLKLAIHFLLIALLTVLSQIGGIVYLITLILAKLLCLGRLKATIAFFSLYLISTFAVVPLIAPIFGRTALPLAGNLQPLNFVTCLLNRHYVKPNLKEQLISISEVMSVKFSGTKTNYLDANFPFYDGFPLLPHLSHNDGKKVDLAFYYTNTKTGERANSTPSLIGYGIYDSPKNNEINSPEKCVNQGYWQYGLLTYIVPKWNSDKFKVDSERTKELIRLLATNELTSKIFIEPHLKARWGLSKYNKIRFHGCQAVRHDDHIHTQIR